ncbi:uncharacterized protein PITG_19303 [Phytophthora infestans T30-4]|uniref:Uncharacterized protein n=1 Tax=Phytophthora infestans (strain T30-4) TaxID=403677 RepID=D0NZW8_PHYIT|nr:uncharacterized protein PITG_19303 [Phytophthora infestans T30-4]EEY69684.1 conserved hypothetical protein [Phytophthora infestans T30-4]|eukprot:XP_002997096.1 conserved hypothetical protein [Phytophthora infestans T30-4]
MRAIRNTWIRPKLRHQFRFEVNIVWYRTRTKRVSAVEVEQLNPARNTGSPFAGEAEITPVHETSGECEQQKLARKWLECEQNGASITERVFVAQDLQAVASQSRRSARMSRVSGEQSYLAFVEQSQNDGVEPFVVVVVVRGSGRLGRGSPLTSLIVVARGLAGGDQSDGHRFDVCVTAPVTLKRVCAVIRGPV